MGRKTLNSKETLVIDMTREVLEDAMAQKIQTWELTIQRCRHTWRADSRLPWGKGIQEQLCFLRQMNEAYDKLCSFTVEGRVLCGKHWKKIHIFCWIFEHRSRPRAAIAFDNTRESRPGYRFIYERFNDGTVVRTMRAGSNV